MFRSIARALAVLVVLVPLSASAQLIVPAGVNLHNGYIEVINHMTYLDGFTAHGIVNVNRRMAGYVGPGGTHVVNWCCIVAGSNYQVELDYAPVAGQRLPFNVTPRLCNIRGIPFGYALIEYTGTVVKRRGSFEIDNFKARRLDEGCPTER